MILPIRHDEYDGQAVPRQRIWIQACIRKGTSSSDKTMEIRGEDNAGCLAGAPQHPTRCSSRILFIYAYLK